MVLLTGSTASLGPVSDAAFRALFFEFAWFLHFSPDGTFVASAAKAYLPDAPFKLLAMLHPGRISASTTIT
jgi:hypothetical protein